MFQKFELKDLFGHKDSVKNEQMEAVAVKVEEAKKQTASEIIEEIHTSFYTEVDSLLKEAKVFRSLDTDQGDLIDKVNRLEALGFNNTKEVMQAKSEIQRLNDAVAENFKKETLVAAINYFSQKYPQYKFITEESVKRICQKYGLIYGAVDKYLGTVPDKNLKQIEEFKIDKNDEAWLHIIIMYGGWGANTREANVVDYLFAETHKNDGHRSSGYYEQYAQAGLEIAAPLKDFNTAGMEVKDFKLSKIEVPDPVVLKPVVFKNKKYYLIVTAWGDEASDELVVNQKMN